MCEGNGGLLARRGVCWVEAGQVQADPVQALKGRGPFLLKLPLLPTCVYPRMATVPTCLQFSLPQMDFLRDVRDG